jgi:hypothetical protein
LGEDGVAVTFEEKRSWVRLGVALLGYLGYLGVLIGRSEGGPVREVPYIWILILSAIVAIVVAAGLEIALAARTPRRERVADDRDREIGRLGDHVGQAFLVIGALAGMGLAMAESDPFWVANVIYLGFVLSAVVGGIARVVVYRVGVPQW